MKLIMNITILITIIFSMVCDQTRFTTEARHLKKTNNHGVGLKKGNANIEVFQDDFKHKERRKLDQTNGQDYVKAGSTDDFAPTNPGNSPGVGHKKGHANVEGFKDDFKHTQRKMLKNVKGFKDALESKEEKKRHRTNGQDHFINGSTDDFAPTSPGNSPGVGHKKGDDFKPTTPGHSPGVGHAFKNNEPKA